jgi:hypothetical protein
MRIACVGWRLICLFGHIVTGVGIRRLSIHGRSNPGKDCGKGRNMGHGAYR